VRWTPHQIYAPDGSPSGGEFQVNTYTTDYQYSPTVGLDGSGGFVVAWVSLGSSGTDSDDSSIQARRYAPDGSPRGDQFQVNATTTNMQLEPEIGPDGTGGFVVAWKSRASSGPDQSGSGILGRRYTPDGEPLGGDFQVNSYTTGTQEDVSIGPVGLGRFVIAWDSAGSSGTDSDSLSVQAQRFTTEIFVDGFESGDTSAWSATVP
jgi:hypothetical protein